MIVKIIVMMCIVSAIAATADKPAATADKPAATADEPASTADKPASTADKPASTADKPAATADKHTSTADKPAATGDKHTSTADKPAATGDKHTSTADKPAATADKHTSTADKPAATGDKHTSTADKPAATGDKHTVTAEKLADTASKPNSTASKPNSTASKPTATADKPAATPKKPTNKSATANKSAAKAVASASPSTFENVDPNTLSCDPNGHIFLLLPHFEHCNKFFMCAHGNEVEFNCAPGTIFDFVLQVCNHPWATKCILRTRPGEEDIEGSGEEEFDWLTDNADHGYVGSANSLTADEVSNSVRPLNIETPGKSPNFNTVLNCLRPDSASRQVPYKGDCQRYWHCTNGVPKTAYCSDGLFFNELLQQCDFEANAKCTDLNDELSNEFIVYKKH